MYVTLRQVVHRRMYSGITANLIHDWNCQISTQRQSFMVSLAGLVDHFETACVLGVTISERGINRRNVSCHKHSQQQRQQRRTQQD